MKKIKAQNAFAAAKEGDSRWRYLQALEGTEGAFLNGVFIPKIRNEFQISRKSKIFTIGSCFARNIEWWLIKNHVDVINFLDALPDKSLFQQYSQGMREAPWAFLYRYNAATIYQELCNITDETYLGTKLMYGQQNRYSDYHYNPSFPLETSDLALSRRRLLREKFSQIRECNLVIITLGLVEAWFDTHNEMYLNVAPDLRLSAKNPGRFECHILDFKTNLSYMRKITNLLQSILPPEGHVVITTSPVPLEVTFSDQNIVVANTYSKHILRAVCQEIVDEYSGFVEYFPSYEIVMNSNQATVWEDDYRHVSTPFVENVVNLFIQSYLGR